jgi:predicted aldo/keto reductase-like oxidoreductase
MLNFYPLNDREYAVIERVQDALNAIDNIPCTKCRYCVKGCSLEIAIPDIFDVMNQYLVFGALEDPKRFYDFYTRNGSTAGKCVECGQCESVCPQHISIMQELKRAAATFER